MAVGDIYRVAVRAQIGADDIVNVFHVRTTLSVGDVENEPIAVAQGVRDEFVELLKAQQNSQLFYNDISVRGVTQPTIGYDLALVGVQGEGVGDLLPFQSAMLVLLRTGHFGRSYQGRQYIGGLEEAAQSNSQFNTGIRTNIQSAYEAIFTFNVLILPALDYAFELGVYSRTLDVFTPVQSVFAQSVVATQRRRKPGVGS